MQLSSFIQEALYEIALGIHAAKVRAKDLVAISPGAMDGESVIEKSYIDFDVSVVVKESAKRSNAGKAGLSGSLQVASFVNIGVSTEAGAGSESTSDTEQVHRISFKVPVYLNANHRADPSMAAEAVLIERLIDRDTVA